MRAGIIVGATAGLLLLALVAPTPGRADVLLQEGEYILFHHADALGSPLAVTDHAGRVLWYEQRDPYGRERDRTTHERNTFFSDRTDSRTGYTGHLQDTATGLTYMKARYYDPVIGRFFSNDPVGFTASNLASFNRYAYANNNPYRYVDPDGRLAIGLLFTPPAIAAFTAAAKYTAGALAGIAIGVGISENVLNSESDPHDGRTVDDPLPRDPRKPTQADPYAPDPDAEGAHTTVGTRTDPKKSPQPYSQGITYDENGNPVSRTDVTDHGRGDHDNPHQHQWDSNRETRYDPDNPGDFGPAEEISE